MFYIYLVTPLTATLVQRSAEHNSTAIRGVASIGECLYVLQMRPDDQLDELNTHDMRLRRKLSVPEEWRDEWRHLSDMASCQHRRRLYVSHNVINCVHVRELTGSEAWSAWETDGSPWGLSVTPGTGNLLVTLRYAGCIDEYSPDGRRLRRVDLSRSGAFSPWHAIMLNSLPSARDLLVIGHGDKADDLARVGLMSVLAGGDGVAQRWYGQCPGIGAHLLSRPQHLAIGRRGTLAVVDVFNDRVVLLDDQLHRVGVVGGPELDRKAGWLASRVCWIGRRLCVAEVQSPDHHRFTSARLSIYDLH